MSGVERTPLLMDSRSPPASSQLSRSKGYNASTTSTRRFGGSTNYPARRSFNTRRSAWVHPLHQGRTNAQSYLSATSSSRRFSSASSARQLTPSSSAASHQTISVPISNKVWQVVVSLPHHMLCFTSPICSPVCGLCCCFTCIRTSEFGVVERFGRFDRIMHPGMHVLKWPMEREAGRISMRIRQLDLNCETKSRDHVFLRVHVSIQYQTNSTHLFESFYSLTSPTRQLTTHTHDIIRSTLPQLDLDDIFASQDSIALDLHRSLNGSMNQYGYLIHHALITKIWPNDHVKESMNEMQASRRTKEAMPHRAEAVRVEKVKDAEARAERAYLNGVGVARERREISRGIRDVVDGVIGDAGGSGVSVSTKGVMDLLLLTQYFDVLADLSNGVRTGKNGDVDGARDEGEEEEERSMSLFMMHMPDTVTRLAETARECFGDATASESTVKVENLLGL